MRLARALLRLLVSGILLASLMRGGVPSRTEQVSAEKMATLSRIRFQGVPQGGGLKLWIKARTLEIATRPGEALRQIASDAAEKINNDQEMKAQGITAQPQGEELRIHVNEVWVYLCPADKGLRVPSPPYDLQVAREGTGLFHLSWKIPRGGYDRIHILRGTVPIADGIDGNNTSFGDVAAGERLTYPVFGILDGVPSCAATF